MSKVPAEVSQHVNLSLPGTPGGGGSDYASFVCYGAPGFSLQVPFWGDFLSNIAPMIVAFIYISLLTYAVLRVQLFDLDLKLKFAVRQGTVGAVIAGGFFVGSEVLESVVPVEGTVLGLTVAGVILLLLRPLQSLAESFASRIMRKVQDTVDYRDGRKQEVYRATFEGAVVDGVLTDREREILAHVQSKLGIAPEKAEQLEREVASLFEGASS